MTQYLREKKALIPGEIDLIRNEAVPMLAEWCSKIGNEPIIERPMISTWLAEFDRVHNQIAEKGKLLAYPEKMRGLSA